MQYQSQQQHDSKITVLSCVSHLSDRSNLYTLVYISHNRITKWDLKLPYNLVQSQIGLPVRLKNYIDL